MDTELLLKEKEELELQINNLVKQFMLRTGLQLSTAIIALDELDKFKGIKLKFEI